MNLAKSFPFILAALLIALLAVSTRPVHAFGGGIAVGMSRLNADGSLAEALDLSFTAKATMETEEYNIEETMYYSPGKLREEIAMTNQNMVTIQRHDLGKLWMIMPQGMYMEHPLDAPSEQAKSFRLIQREQVGTETVNGMQTTKYKTIWETDDGRFGGFSWVNGDGIAVKAFLVSEQNGEKQRIRYQITEISMGEQPDSLFEVPDGFAKMDLSGMRGFAGMTGGMQPPQQGSPEEQSSLPEDLTEAATEGAKESAESETRYQVGKKVRDGIRGLFSR